MHENQDFVVVVAAGNRGSDTPAGSIAIPGTAKNCVTVGASEGIHDRYAVGSRKHQLLDFSSRSVDSSLGVLRVVDCDYCCLAVPLLLLL